MNIMDKKKNKQQHDMKDDQTKQAGRQGVDKAPGEDSPRGNTDDAITAQKAKKVDADPSKKGERPDS